MVAVLLAVALASLTGPGVGFLAGGEGFLWSFWVADGVATGLGWRGAVACGGVGRASSTALDFNRTVNALPVGLACCLGAG